MLVKRLLLLLPFLMAVPAHAEISPEVKATCMEAKDFVGCVQALSGGVKIESDDGLGALRKAMKQVASRLSSGTSLNNSSATFQPVIDAHAVVPENKKNSLAYRSATMAINLFDLAQSVWQSRINNTASSVGINDLPGVTHLLYQCNNFKAQVNLSYGILGTYVPWNFQETGLFGGGCNLSSNSPETPLYRYTVGILREGTTDPQEIDDYIVELNEAKKLAALGPWTRYLKKNPGMAAWAKANPNLAAAKKEKYIEEHGSDIVEMPSFPANFRYLRGTKVESMLSGSAF